MKKVFVIIFLFWNSIYIASAMDMDCDSTDFCSFVKMVETNYSGFPTKVNRHTQCDYDQFKVRLFNSIVLENRRGYDAAAEFAAWFRDYHLTLGTLSEKYMKPRMRYDTITYKPQFVSSPVDDTTYLIRIPSFGYEENIVSFLKNAVSEYKESGKENLILDLRGNGGGLDFTFTPLLELIYNRPFKIDGAEFRATPDVAQLLREAYETQNGQPSWAIAVADSIKIGRYEFVPIPGMDKEISLDTINVFPRKVAIVVDNGCASSTEQFIILAKSCADRVMVYGKDKTLGALDYTNPMPYELPCSKIPCMIPTSRTIGISDDNPGIDPAGIAPDVIIPLSYPSEITDNIDSWICWIANHFAR